MFSLLLSVSVALATPTAVLVVESNDKSVNGKGISNIHFGAAINGALLSNQLIPYMNDADFVYQTLQIADGTIPLVLQEDNNVLVASASNSTLFAKPVNGYLTINGTDSVFYACSKIAWDPYRYVSAENKGVGVYSKEEVVPQECEPIKIRVETNSTSSVASTTEGTETSEPTETSEVTKTGNDSPTDIAGVYGGSNSNNNTIVSTYLSTVNVSATDAVDTAAGYSIPEPTNVSNHTVPTSAILANGANKLSISLLAACALLL